MIILWKKKNIITNMRSARVRSKCGQMSFMEKMPFEQNFEIIEEDIRIF